MPRKFYVGRKKTQKKQAKSNFKRKVLAVTKQYSDKRYTYSTIGSTGVSNSGAYLTGAQLLDTVPGDSTFAERQGDVITPTRIIMRYQLDVGDTSNFFRVILFQWRPDSNSFPPTAILNNVIDTSSLGTNYAPSSRYIFDQKNFHILYDSHVHSLVDTASNMCLARTVNIYGKKLRPIRYTNGADLGHNNIYCIVLSDSAVAPHPAISMTLEMHYNA